MCCPIVALFMGLPRVALFFMWVFTDRLSIAFENFWLPLLGFCFLPFTTIFWAIAYAPISEVTGVGWLFVAFGFVLDVASYVGGGRYRRYDQSVA